MARPRLRVHAIGALCLSLAAPACSEDMGSPFAVEVVSFEPGPGAGFGQGRFPDVVLGPPAVPGANAGSLDVLSLGQGGSIVVRLGRSARNGAGPDLVVFENPFPIASGSAVFGESGEVAVSADGEDFVAFPCAAEASPPVGCAGWGPVRGDAASLEGELPVDPAVVGGDAFDLEDVGLAEASFVRITDRGRTTQAPSAGFDLDAVAVAAQPEG